VGVGLGAMFLGSSDNVLRWLEHCWLRAGAVGTLQRGVPGQGGCNLHGGGETCCGVGWWAWVGSALPGDHPTPI